MCAVCISVNEVEEADAAHRKLVCAGVGGCEVRLTASGVVPLPIGLIAHGDERYIQSWSYANTPKK